MKKAIALVLACALTMSAEKKGGFHRVPDDDILTASTKVRFTTMILLPPGEEIDEVVCGDREFWVIEGKGSFLYVKPAKEGAATNLYIVSKSKVVYSVLLQEISRPGSKDKPDLKVMLGPDELSQLRKDKAALEELVANSDPYKAVGKKKDSLEASPSDSPQDVAEPALPPSPTPISTTLVSHAIPSAKPNEGVKPQVQKASMATFPLPTMPLAGEVPPTPAPPDEAAQAKPTMQVVVVDRPKSGFLRKTGRFLGRLLGRINDKLRIY